MLVLHFPSSAARDAHTHKKNTPIALKTLTKQSSCDFLILTPEFYKNKMFLCMVADGYPFQKWLIHPRLPNNLWPVLHFCLQLDLSQPLEDQGPLDVIIHKLTDLILEADQNDSQAVLLVQRVQVCICLSSLISLPPPHVFTNREKT